jgi:hypothetical protein
MVVLTIAPLAFFYELGRFLMPKLQAGHWEWWFLFVGVVLAAAFAVDFITGHYGSGYGPWRKPTQQLLPPNRSWEDGLPRPD